MSLIFVTGKYLVGKVSKLCVVGGWEYWAERKYFGQGVGRQILQVGSGVRLSGGILRLKSIKSVEIW
jgi:hypothetical protein